MPTCSECGGTTIEYDAAAGNGFCTDCGTVVEENTIVSEITFGETSGGAAIVQGAFVGQGATTAKLNNPFSRHHGGGSSESREMTIANATRKIQSIANLMRLPDTVVLAATRLYTLAVEHKFTKGRKSMNVVAVCLYVACRQKEAGTRSWMLIDFSDLLQVNVFELGHCYLNLIQALHLRLPLVDPSHYISRFASLLEFGDDSNRVAQDAVRIVARFDRDWMTRGRRPAGICGAALLLAARMNGFSRSVEEIVQIVKIADTTLKKRLEEFKSTPSGQLTVADFRNVWLDEECDPPAYAKNREAERVDVDGENNDEAEDGDDEGEGRHKKKKGKGKKKDKEGKKGKRGKGKKRKRPESDISGDESGKEKEQEEQKPGLDPDLFKQGILSGVLDLDPSKEFVPPISPSDAPEPSVTTAEATQTDEPARDAEDISNIDPLLRQPASSPSNQSTMPESTPPPSQTSPSGTAVNLTQASTVEPPASEANVEVEASLDATLTEDISSILASNQGAQLAEVLDAKEKARLEGIQKRREEALATAKAANNKSPDASQDTIIEPSELPADNEDGALSRQASGFGGATVQQDDIDGLLDLDEAELDWFILNEDEVKLKERVWVEMNRDYLEALALKGDQDASASRKSRKKRKSAKPRDASTASGSTAAESVRKMMKKNPKYSKRINYDALKDLLDSGEAARISTPFPGLPSLEDKDEADMYYMTPDRTPGPPSSHISDSEKDAPVVVIQEDEGTVGVPSQSNGRDKDKNRRSGGETTEADEDEDEDQEEDFTSEMMHVDDEKEEDGGWDDGWEQEI